MIKKNTIYGKSATFNYNGLAKMLNTELRNAVVNIRNNAKRAGKVATGNTIMSIINGVSIQAPYVHGVIEAPRHFATMEEGRGPTRNIQNIDLPSIIYEWSIAKGITMQDNRPGKKHRLPFDEDKARRAWSKFIAYRIHKFGTVQYRKGPRRDVYSNELEKVINGLEKRIEAGGLYDVLGIDLYSNLQNIQTKIDG